MNRQEKAPKRYSSTTSKQPSERATPGVSSHQKNEYYVSSSRRREEILKRPDWDPSTHSAERVDKRSQNRTNFDYINSKLDNKIDPSKYSSHRQSSQKVERDSNRYDMKALDFNKLDIGIKPSFESMTPPEQNENVPKAITQTTYIDTLNRELSSKKRAEERLGVGQRNSRKPNNMDLDEQL